MDTSYLVEGLVHDHSLLRGHVMFAPDFAMYEVVNAVWKREVLLKNLPTDSATILAAFFDFVESEGVIFAVVDKTTMRSAYTLAVRTRTPVYDAVFVALARELGVELKTFDKRQAEIYRKE